jgi:hypothetical protein
MKIELILLGVIGLVFLVDFIMNSSKKSQIDEKLTIEESDKKTYNQFILQFLLVLFNVLLFLIPFQQGGSIFSVIETLWADEFFYFTDLELHYYHLLILNLPLIFIGTFIKRNNEFANFLDYLTKRKKNFTLYIISIPLIKVLIHYMFYPELRKVGRTGTVISNKTERDYFGVHLDLMFKDEIWLFIPTFILVSLLVWFFNDKIKAR